VTLTAAAHQTLAIAGIQAAEGYQSETRTEGAH
jgi:hypothetical protein